MMRYTILTFLVLCWRLDASSDPSTWTAPRNVHQEIDAQHLERISIKKVEKGNEDSSGASFSPNHSYWMKSLPPTGTSQVVMITTDRNGYLISFRDSYSNFPIQTKWVNEKILFLRVYWGRIVGTDVLVDAETGKFLYMESFVDGTQMFQQAREASQGKSVEGE